MIVTLKSCPFCGENDLIIKGDAELSWIYCKDCGVETAMADSYAETVSSWNARREGKAKEYEIESEEEGIKSS